MCLIRQQWRKGKVFDMEKDLVNIEEDLENAGVELKIQPIQEGANDVPLYWNTEVMMR